MKRKLIAITFSLATACSLNVLADDAATTNNNPNQAQAAAESPNAPILAQNSTNATSNTTPTTMSPDQVQQIQKVIHDYLVQNPEVLIEASQALQMKEAQKAEAAAQTAIVQYKSQLFNDPASPAIGNPNGNVIIAEFFDYQCSHCKAMNDTIQALIKKNPNLKVILKELPIFGGNSQFAAQAALASAKQGKYEQFHNALLAADNPVTQAKVLSIAKKVGLDLSQLKKDMNSADVQKQIQDNFKLAQALKLMGTPTFVLSDKNMSQFKFIPGQTTQDDLQNKINVVSGQPASSSANSATTTSQS